MDECHPCTLQDLRAYHTFFQEFLAGEGDVIRHLSALGYTVSQEQSHIGMVFLDLLCIVGAELYGNDV